MIMKKIGWILMSYIYWHAKKKDKRLIHDREREVEVIVIARVYVTDIYIHRRVRV